MKNDMDFLAKMSDEEVRVMWKWTVGSTFPGRNAALVRMTRGVTPSARKALGRFFATLAPRTAFVAVAALLQVVLRDSSDRRPMAQAPQTLHHQLAQYRVTPARAP
ncbi:MAG: hypothetical protein JWO67_4120 [Streptosporangiaceae bacterium]|nr:hypothetical protein [Streptosporangiaceae bacterium]